MHSKCGRKRKVTNPVGVSSDNSAKRDSEVNNSTIDRDTGMKPEAVNASSSEEEHICEDSTNKAQDFGNFPSSEVLIVEPLAIGVSTTREICISVLKHNKLLGGPQLTNTSSSLKGADLGDRDEFTRCKICGIVSKSRRMLICDFCEEAFHLHCCNEKGPFNDGWYCKNCLAMDIKSSKKYDSGKISARKIFQEFRRKMKHTQPHKSKVRIGQNYQLQVPEWLGPISADDDCFGEPSELQPEEYTGLDTWKFTREKHGPISNWVQCKSLLDGGAICGKWRRAPLYVTQNNDWECFCAVVWDPIHADCAVPQELETKEVLKGLRYIESLNARMKWRQKSRAKISKIN